MYLCVSKKPSLNRPDAKGISIVREVWTHGQNVLVKYQNPANTIIVNNEAEDLGHGRC